MIKNFLNPLGHQNCISGSKVTASLLKGEFCLLVQLHQEGSAPATCTAGLFFCFFVLSSLTVLAIMTLQTFDVFDWVWILDIFHCFETFVFAYDNSEARMSEKCGEWRD